MADRETVLKGLGICARGCSEDCNYWDQGYDCQESLIADALEQLKHQPEIIHCRNCAHFETDHWGRSITYQSSWHITSAPSGATAAPPHRMATASWGSTLAWDRKLKHLRTKIERPPETD